MKIYVVYTTSGDDNSEVLFEGAFASEEAAQKHIDDTFTIPRRYAWSIQGLELKHPRRESDFEEVFNRGEFPPQWQGGNR